MQNWKIAVNILYVKHFSYYSRASYSGIFRTLHNFVIFRNWGKLRTLWTSYGIFRKFLMATIRNSHQRCSVRKGVLRNFTKFTGKDLCQSLFFWVQSLRPATLLIKEALAQVFSCEFGERSKNTFFTEHLRVRELLLYKFCHRYLTGFWICFCINRF